MVLQENVPVVIKFKSVTAIPRRQICISFSGPFLYLIAINKVLVYFNHILAFVFFLDKTACRVMQAVLIYGGYSKVLLIIPT